MQNELQNPIWESENAHMEAVYQTLKRTFRKDDELTELTENQVQIEKFDDSDFLPSYDAQPNGAKHMDAADIQYAALYQKPYFAHLVLQDAEGEPKHFFLSDCEVLDHAVSLDDHRTLVPFQQAPDPSVFSALYRFYLSGGREVSLGGLEQTAPVLNGQLTQICHDQIRNRKLLGAVRLFPEDGPSERPSEALFLARLEESRKKPALRNLISTLQERQFQIIDTDLQTSFVVQGCSGSGKTQCLLHRLFYHRNELAQEGWNHVLLLTPTQLFRNYADRLIQRYQLSELRNCSLTDLYRSLLIAFDSRIQKRQYRFAPSEEHLPDGYLQEIYSEATIRKIDQEIEATLTKCVQNACAALGTELPDRISAETITTLVRQLDAMIAETTSRDATLAGDIEYNRTLDRFHRLQKRLPTKQRRLETLLQDQTALSEQIDQFRKLQDAAQSAYRAMDDAKQQRNARLEAAQQELSELTAAFCGDFPPDLPKRYASQLSRVQQLASGLQTEEETAHMKALEQAWMDAESALQKCSGTMPPARLNDQYQRKMTRLQDNIRSVSDEINIIGKSLTDLDVWLKQRVVELVGDKPGLQIQTTDLRQARYPLSRMESYIFDQVIWDTVLPIREKYHVAASELTSVSDRRQKETKQLYRADLLFYLKIVSRLHPKDCLPDYRLICIDEGQDLHRADYDMLRFLYPDAVFNVYGDTAQALRASTGVQDWKTDTGISNLFTLDRDCRNPAAIADFCTRNLGSALEGIGPLDPEAAPIRLLTPNELRDAALQNGMTLIVKDHDALVRLCQDCGIDAKSFEFMDETAGQCYGNKPPCYSVYAVKGLEFTDVVVDLREMTENQKRIACTRTTGRLYYYE